jgi:undecaprenyldiphospho-muramoylpentapeptide beta-N-acetylglucosaminyltransferase
MRLVICAGGTGGGVYPALAVHQALIDLAPAPPEVLWVGGEGGMEAELVRREGIQFQAVPAAGVHGVGWRALPGNLNQLRRGYLASRRILRDFQPQALFSTGGYVAVPMAIAARSLGRHKPATILYVPDIEPGMALKFLARFADRIALTAEESKDYFGNPNKLTISGYPVRQELGHWDKNQAMQTLGLADGLPTLLVFGGSKGARSINRALLAGIPELLQKMQIVHISGSLDWPEVQAAGSQLPAALQSHYKAFSYLHEEMGAALSAADLVVARAGASTLGEFPLFGLPALLVPYPHAWRYQMVNAEYLVSHGAALLMADEDMIANLVPIVLKLMEDTSGRSKMQQAMQALANPNAARAIAAEILALANINSQEGNGW